eukprot:NODE_388_length_1557_cov_17.130070_g356_i0.p1 GENE.NODE_388_length_1557_cov_17.130070_g356_i0~~NODE_388_length_1557_cov_17.130070_g356_i0.p1  ORF type:complete len:108 (-),score=1.80 NODE_388_length_1557_cov_17.130070_g356_i0:33-356(-)
MDLPLNVRQRKQSLYSDLDPLACISLASGVFTKTESQGQEPQYLVVLLATPQSPWRPIICRGRAASTVMEQVSGHASQDKGLRPVSDSVCIHFQLLHDCFGHNTSAP